MQRHLLLFIPLFITCSCSLLLRAAGADGPLALHPGSIRLDGRHAIQRVVVMATLDGQRVDVTREAQLEVIPQEIARLDADGAVVPMVDGEAILQATWKGRASTAKILVVNAARQFEESFELHVQPILTARGCNSGACHGKARGQNGFQFSLLGFDPAFDHASITRHARGRRLFPAAPEQSLLLLKATAQVPHGGGRRLQEGARDYGTLLRWIAAGAPRQVQGEPLLTKIDVFPRRQFLRPKQGQQLLVTAHYSDGTRRDVTHETTFQSNESAVVKVVPSGRMTAGPIPGEASIMARFMGQIGTCLVTIPLANPPPDEYYAALPRNNLVDVHVWNKLRDLGFTASEPVDDATFLRRVQLDIIGRVPTPAEVRRFLASEQANKRELVVERLLKDPAYADHWANKWVDLLRPNPYRVGIKAVLNYDNWVRQAFRENRPYDEFVRQLLTSQGSTWRNGAVTLFRDRRSPAEVTTLVSQMFLGIRLECAKCHHHPFEVWSQNDFYGFAAYFAKVGYKGTGLSPPISGGEEIVLVRKSGEVKHPLTGKTLEPTPLFGQAPDVGNFSDPRQALAEWMTSDDNEFFAKAIVNRVWSQLMGRGFVDPVDDLRVTNPPTNAPLLNALAEEFQQQKYDLKQLIRTIVFSRVYSLSTVPTKRNIADRRYFSRYQRQRLRAEVLLDAISDITAVPTTFAAMPADSRANQIWTHRVPSLFLDTFGRPDPNQDPPCQRVTDSAVTQALHMMNAPNLHAKITAKESRISQLSQSTRTDDEVVEELYLWVYSRFPDQAERDVGRKLFGDKARSRKETAEDLVWALLNTPEFLFKN